MRVLTKDRCGIKRVLISSDHHTLALASGFFSIVIALSFIAICFVVRHFLFAIFRLIRCTQIIEAVEMINFLFSYPFSEVRVRAMVRVSHNKDHKSKEGRKQMDGAIG